MRKPNRRFSVCAMLGSLFVGVIAGAQDRANDNLLAGWTADFGAEKADLGPTGRNPYFILEPGYVLVLEGRRFFFRQAIDEPWQDIVHSNICRCVFV